MTKRKANDEEDEVSTDAQDSPTIKKPKIKTHPKPKKNVIRNNSTSDSEDSSRSNLGGDERTSVKKKVKNEQKKESKKSPKNNTPNESSDVVIKANSDGDKYIELGKKKRITIRSFKGTPLIDIREFYGADGDEKPGKKGISLTPDQWAVLKNSSSTIDRLFGALKGKPDS